MEAVLTTNDKNGDNVNGSGCSWPPTPYDQFGVDNNRNFPFKWNCCGGSSSYECDQTYHGVGAEWRTRTRRS